MTTNNESILKPKQPSRDEYLFNAAQTAVVAIMAAILHADPEFRNTNTYADSVESARSIYQETMQQIERRGL